MALSDEDFERLADEAERGYDVTPLLLRDHESGKHQGSPREFCPACQGDGWTCPHCQTEWDEKPLLDVFTRCPSCPDLDADDEDGIDPYADKP